MMAQPAFASFGDQNQGLQVGQNYGQISAEVHLPPERVETPPRPFATIPFARDPDFVERGNILEQIEQRCSQPGGRVALAGFGGVGKSQLAIEYAHRTATERASTWLFWIHASTRARVDEGFRAIADAVKLAGRKQPNADILQLVYRWLLNERNGNWVMVLDSADDGNVFNNASDGASDQPLATYLPQSQNGSILITTRDKDLARSLTGTHRNIIEVGPMAQADALLLLEKKLGPFSDKETAVELIRALECIPLAISQAAGYIQARTPRSSLAKYLEEFRKGERKRIRLLGHDSSDLHRVGASKSVLTTWQISFDHIRSKRPSAADLLSLMSFFDRQGIPESLLKYRGVQGQHDKQEEWGSDEGQDSGSESTGDADDVFEDDVAMLRDYCLVTISQDGSEFEMHGLVQLSTRRWLEAGSLQEKFKQQFIEQMAASFPTGDYSNWATCQRLFAHVVVAAGIWPVGGEVEESWAVLLHNGAWYAWLQGRYEVAEQMAGKARRSREERLGREDKDSLASTLLFALVLRDRGRWDDAEKLFVQVMETRKTKLGPDHPSTLTSMANLASTYRNQGRWDDAEKLEVQVMEMSKTKLGPDHLDTLTSMANLASTYWNQGQWDNAEKLDVQVMEIRKTKLGPDHLDTLTSMANLASTYWNQGRWDDAEKLEVQVMEIRKMKLGPDHPSTLTSIANLASTYQNQGRWDDAEKLEVQVMETRKTKLGPDHPDTLTSMANLASTYQNQGRWDDAEKLEVQVMEMSKTKLGPDHPDTLTSLANLASTYRNQGRWDDAEELLVPVIEISKTKLGPDHPDTLTSMNNLARTWKGQGRKADALILMKECVERQQRTVGPEHPYTLSSLAAVRDWN